MNNYIIYEELGKGSHSVVHKGRKKRSVDFVTLKSFQKQNKNKLLNEAAILSKLHNDNIIKLKNWHETRNHFWGIYEFLAGGDLDNILKEDKVLSSTLIIRREYDSQPCSYDFRRIGLSSSKQSCVL